MTTPAPPGVPPGFTPLGRGGPFLQLFGPLYGKKTETSTIIGLCVEEKHLNTGRVAHGGMLVTLADSALGIAVWDRLPSGGRLVTVSLATDFVETARLGDFVEAHVDVQKVGKRLAFASCYLLVGARRILRASGVFAVLPSAPPREGFEG